MGHIISTYWTKPDVMPVYDSTPTFDPLYGFPNGRKPRGMFFFLLFSFGLRTSKLCVNLLFLTMKNYLFRITEMKLTEAEMQSAKLPMSERGYCADKALDILVCRRQNWPFVYKCAHEKHSYLNCQYEE